jgi:hypothetical protein
MREFTMFACAILHRIVAPVEVALRGARKTMDALAQLRMEEIAVLAELAAEPTSMDAARDAVTAAECALEEYKASPLAELAECSDRGCASWAGWCDYHLHCAPLQALYAVRAARDKRSNLESRLRSIQYARNNLRRKAGL